MPPSHSSRIIGISPRGVESEEALASVGYCLQERRARYPCRGACAESVPRSSTVDSFIAVDHTHPMSKRLQVIVDDTELHEIKQAAQHQQLTVAEWVRQALRAARRREPHSDATRKLEVVRAAVAHSFPSGSVEQMLAEIESGYARSGQP